jgi:hypothetical protein
MLTKLGIGIKKPPAFLHHSPYRKKKRRTA